MKRTNAVIACALIALGASSAFAAPKAADAKAIVGSWKATAIIGTGETAMFASLDFARR